VPGYRHTKAENQRLLEARLLRGGRRARRARAVALLKAGATYREIQEALGCGPSFVARWRKRLKQQGVTGIDGRHKGRRPLIRGYRRRRLMELLEERDFYGYPAFTHAEIARRLGVAPQTVTRYVARREIEIPDIHDGEIADMYIGLFQREHLDLVGLFLSPRQNIFAFASRGAKPGLEREFNYTFLRDGPGRVRREHAPRALWYGGTRVALAGPMAHAPELRGRQLYLEIQRFLTRVDARFPQLALIVADHNTRDRRSECYWLMHGRVQAALNFVDTSKLWIQSLREVSSWVAADMRAQGELDVPRNLPDLIIDLVKSARRLPGRAIVWVHDDGVKHRALSARRWLVTERRRLTFDS